MTWQRLLTQCFLEFREGFNCYNPFEKRKDYKEVLGLLWNENKQNGNNDQKYWNIKQEKNARSKNGLKTDGGLFSSGSVGEFKFARMRILS